MEDKELGELDVNFELEDELETDCDCDCNFNYTPSDPKAYPVYIATDNVDECLLDEEQFQKGLDSVSFLCGQITGLVNAGIPPADALGYLTDMKVLESNKEMALINKETSVAVAKEQAINVEKNSL